MVEGGVVAEWSKALLVRENKRKPKRSRVHSLPGQVNLKKLWHDGRVTVGLLSRDLVVTGSVPAIANFFLYKNHNNQSLFSVKSVVNKLARIDTGLAMQPGAWTN